MRCKVRHAMVLLDLFVALSILSLFIVLAAAAMRDCIQLTAGSAQFANSTLTGDHAVRQLRADVWNALSVENTGASELRIKPAGRDSIRYRAAADGALERMVNDLPAGRWVGLGAIWQFEVTGDSVRITRRIDSHADASGIDSDRRDAMPATTSAADRPAIVLMRAAAFYGEAAQ